MAWSYSEPLLTERCKNLYRSRCDKGYKFTSSALSFLTWTTTRVAHTPKRPLQSKIMQNLCRTTDNWHRYAKRETWSKYKLIIIYFPQRDHWNLLQCMSLRLSPRQPEENQCDDIITDRYFKLTRAIPSSQFTTRIVGYVFLHDWIIPYERIL